MSFDNVPSAHHVSGGELLALFLQVPPEVHGVHLDQIVLVQDRRTRFWSSHGTIEYRPLHFRSLLITLKRTGRYPHPGNRPKIHKEY